MPQVLNRSNNASTLINGVAFSKVAKGMLSEEISQEQADYFLSIPSYVAVKAAAPVPPVPPVAPKQPADPVPDPAVAAAAAATAEAERQAAEQANAAAQAKQQA